MTDLLINIKNLTIGYSLDKILATEINANVYRGELIALIGKNGSGKTTLIKTLIGINKILYGDIFIKNKNIKDIDIKKMASIISYVSTSKIYVPNAKVKDIIALGRSVYANWFGKLNAKDYDIINQSMKMVDIEHLAEKNILQLSDGERQRVMIARAIAQDTDIIILDEPTAFLDLSGRFMIYEILNKLTQEQNKTIIFSTHDIESVIDNVDKIWLLNSEKLIISDTVEFIDNNFFDIILKGTNKIYDKKLKRITEK